MKYDEKSNWYGERKPNKVLCAMSAISSGIF